METFKQRGVLVLGVFLVLALIVVEAVKAVMGWQTGRLGNALVVAVLAFIIGLVLRRYGFYPFAKKPTL